MNTKLKEKLKVATDQVKDIDYQSDLAEEKVAMQESFIKKVEEDVDNRINERKQELKSHLEKKNSLDLQYFSLAEDMGFVAEEISKVVFDKSKIKQLNGLRGKFEGKIEHANKNIAFFNQNDNCPTILKHIGPIVLIS